MYTLETKQSVACELETDVLANFLYDKIEYSLQH